MKNPKNDTPMLKIATFDAFSAFYTELLDYRALGGKTKLVKLLSAEVRSFVCQMLAIPKIDEPTLAEDDPVLQDLSEKKHKSKLRKYGENAAISRLASVLRPKRQEQCLNLLRMKLSSFTPIEVSRLNTKFNNTLACLALEEDDSVIETYLRAFAFRGQALYFRIKERTTGKSLAEVQHYAMTTAQDLAESAAYMAPLADFIGKPGHDDKRAHDGDKRAHIDGKRPNKRHG
ncbi:hypothetical protein J8273_7551 [Carpediemonas membranifera]|uniref:Uncharacterized protein n=1 Tax=Carpediemonas membranifera TaxID=201153 RepID=A0A8J6B748_9EUKA|nr:hypothetical protein J8273_7551 [Carpediemonas membranifera]|eukprot:KAG9391362.1 hypothetical protein J8273_7551 [Carpediemonas membranifera]